MKRKKFHKGLVRSESIAPSIGAGLVGVNNYEMLIYSPEIDSVIELSVNLPVARRVSQFVGMMIGVTTRGW